MSREFIILSLFFLLAMFPFIHITIDLLRDQFLFISAAVDSLLIQLVTFHEFRIQTTPFRFSERNLFEQINIHREAAVKRRTTKLKFTVALLNPIFTSFTLIRIPGPCYVFLWPAAFRNKYSWISWTPGIVDDIRRLMTPYHLTISKKVTTNVITFSICFYNASLLPPELFFFLVWLFCFWEEKNESSANNVLLK